MYYLILRGDDIMRKRHPGGRPPKYTEAEKMEYKISEYFESCFIPSRDRAGNILRDEKRKCNKDSNKTFYYFWSC